MTRATHADAGAPILTERAWNRLRHNGKLVRDEVTGHLPPEMRARVWEEFKRLPSARIACSLIQLLEPEQVGPQPSGLYRRRPKLSDSANPFHDIESVGQRHEAETIFAKLCERHSHRLPSCPWLRPILAGRARHLATNPNAHGSAWGRQMRRKKGGKHAQRRFRQERRHPLESVRKNRGFD